MRVAALYDVHGNVFALEAVLGELGDVDVVLFGGDLAWGAFPKDTLDLARSVPDAEFIRGNADEMDDPDFPRDARREFVAEQLGEADIAWLVSRPFSAAAKGRMPLLTAIYMRLIYQTYGGSIHHRSRRLEGTGLLPRADASAASCLPIRSRWDCRKPFSKSKAGPGYAGFIAYNAILPMCRYGRSPPVLNFLFTCSKISPVISTVFTGISKRACMRRFRRLWKPW